MLLLLTANPRLIARDLGYLATGHDYDLSYQSGFSYHPPENLLDGPNDKLYMSVLYKTSGDWITFRMTKPVAYITKIRIGNSNDDSGIRCVALFVGSDQLKSKWVKLCKEITDIKRKSRVQEFGFKSSVQFMSEKFNLLKLEILNNHGADYNTFYQFEVFGSLLFCP
eukprot:177978_1